MEVDLQSPGFYTYKCKKPDCYFCQKTRPEEHRKEYPLNAVTVGPSVNYWKYEEIDILLQNLNADYPTLMKLLPKRNRPALAMAKVMNAKKHGYKFDRSIRTWYRLQT